jgi:hypothetical protein
MSAKLLKERDAAELLSCSARHLRNLRRKRLLPFFRLGGAIRYSVVDIEAALKKLKVEALG